MSILKVQHNIRAKVHLAGAVFHKALSDHNARASLLQEESSNRVASLESKRRANPPAKRHGHPVVGQCHFAEHPHDCGIGTFLMTATDHVIDLTQLALTQSAKKPKELPDVVRSNELPFAENIRRECKDKRS